jgi:hypothetical protein
MERLGMANGKLAPIGYGVAAAVLRLDAFARGAARLEQTQ